MKMVRNIALIAIAATFSFAQMNFHMGNNFSTIDGDMTAMTSYGVTWELNNKAELGYDSKLGMLFHFDAGAVDFRMGWNQTFTSVGLGKTWDMFSSSNGVNTSISTNYDMMITDGGAGVDNTYDGNLSVVIGFGF